MQYFHAQVQLFIAATSHSEACDLVTDLLTENGIHFKDGPTADCASGVLTIDQLASTWPAAGFVDTKIRS